MVLLNLCNNRDQTFINIRKVPREVLKTLGFALIFQKFPRDLANVDEWKIMFDPTIIDKVCSVQLHVAQQMELKIQESLACMATYS